MRKNNNNKTKQKHSIQTGKQTNLHTLRVYRILCDEWYMNTLRHLPSCLSLLPGPPAACLPPLVSKLDQHQCACPASPFVSLAKIFAVHWLWLANVKSSPITIPSFFILRRLAEIWSGSFLSKNLTRTGLDLVPPGVPVLWATSMSVTAVLTLTFWSKMSQHFFLQSSTVSPSPSGSLNTRRFQRLEYCC